MFRWLTRKTPHNDPRKTRDLSPGALADSARHRDLFELLELFLVRRVESELALEEKKAEVRLKQAEADAETKLKLDEIRQQRRQLRASQAAERNRTYPRDEKGRIRAANGAYGCAVCANPGSPHLTVEQIRLHHASGHGNGGTTASN